MKARFRIAIGLLVVSFTFVGAVSAQTNEEKLKHDVLSLSKRIDAIIDARLQKEKIKAFPPAADTEFFRRLNLDLTGRIPEYLYVLDFLEDDRDLDFKRWMWVERFIADERFSQHFAVILRDVMIQNRDDRRIIVLLPQFENWLRERIKSDTPYDKITHELLTSSPYRRVNGFVVTQPSASTSGSTAAFYQSAENKAENLAGATARVFLGVKIECAQCHAHPFAKWKQEQFWEFAAFFSGNRPTVPVPGRVPVANVNSKTIMIPGTKTVVKAKFLNGKEPNWKDNDDPVRVLADWVIAKENPFFAKAAVDVIWTYFFGISLLTPIYEPDADAIAHRELIDELAKEFVAQNYSIKFLVRSIIHSKAYQRTTRSKMKSKHGDLELFARMPVRAMSPEQLYDSIVEALDIQTQQTSQPNMRFSPFNQQSPRAKFLAKFASPEKRNERQTSILQALFMMNGEYLAKHTRLAENESLNTIATAPTSTEKRVQSLYLIALSRYPRPEETKRIAAYINSGGPMNNPRQAVADVYWALLNSGEFMLNH